MKKSNKIYQFLKSKQKRIALRAIILALLLLGINTYAWFIYLNRFSGSITASVIDWEVDLYDEDTTINEVTVAITNMKPGMSNYTKQIMVANNGSVSASLTYEIENITIFGVSYLVDDVTYTSDGLITALATGFPFAITFSQSKNSLNSGGDTATFTINGAWPFEATNAYFRVSTFFDYNHSFTYYTLSNDVYTADTTVSATNYSSKVSSGLYLEADDADTYWGSKAATYKASNPDDPSIVLHLKLKVTQSAT